MMRFKFEFKTGATFQVIPVGQSIHFIIEFTAPVRVMPLGLAS